MAVGFEKLFKSDEEVKQDILRDFAIEFLDEVEKLVAVYGKEEVMSLVSNRNNNNQEALIIKEIA